MKAREACFGCVHSRYRGSHSVKGVMHLVGATAIPLREEDGKNAPGRYECAKFGELRFVARADRVPRELEPGCKERR